MRRLRAVGAVAVLALLAAGCGGEVGRYEFGQGLCRLDTMSGEVVCPGQQTGTTRLLIPAGPHKKSTAEEPSTEKFY